MSEKTAVSTKSPQNGAFSLKSKGGWLVALLSIVLYLNTIPHDYALDDKIAITHNSFTKQGLKGIPDLLTTDYMTGFFGREKKLVAGGRYRPLSPISFAIEWAFFGENPHISHAINALLYGVLIWLLYAWLQLLFKEQSSIWYAQKSFWIAMLFAFHPLHTEVVANIKSRDEIMGFIAGLIALIQLLRYLDDGKAIRLLWAALVFFIGLMSKETSVTLLAAVPLMAWFYRTWNWKKVMMGSLALIAGLVPYLVMRLTFTDGSTEINPEIMNDPFLRATIGEKYATIVYTFGLYLKMLVIPHPLTHDYYPFQIPIIGWADMRAIVPLLLHTVLIGAGIYFTWVRKRSYGFMIWFYLATFSIVSNVVFPIGTFMNERFMFVPSLSFAMLIVELGFLIHSNQQKSFPIKKWLLIMLPILLLYGFKTIDRNKAWKDDFTLATTDVKVSSNSAKVLMSAGGALSDRAANLKEPSEQAQKQQYLVQSEGYLKKALKLYPTYFIAMRLMGINQYRQAKFSHALAYWDGCFQINPDHEQPAQDIIHLSDTLVKLNQFPLAIKCLETVIDYQPMNGEAYAKLAEIHARYLQDLPTGEKYARKGFEIDPSNTNIAQKLGIIQAMQGNPRGGIRTFFKGLKHDPDNAHILMNIGVTYQKIGVADSAVYYLNKAREADPNVGKN